MSVLDGAVSALSLRSRRRKLRLFMELMRPDDGTTVVDVGVADGGFGEAPGHAFTHNFFEASYPWPHRITAVGVTELERFRAAFPTIRAVTADGLQLPFSNGEFDIGLSNAVVEHVGDRDAQVAFVHELCRVARRVFVTTPNRWFPVDVHTLLPLAHLAPGRRIAGGTRLLGPSDLQSLFPYPVRVVNSGLTLVAVGGC